MTDTVCSV